MMKRRVAIKNIGVIVGGLTVLPYSCSSEHQLLLNNLTPHLKSKQLELIGFISSLILPPNDSRFPTNESRQEFVLTMINDCYSEPKIKKLTHSLKSFEAKTIKSYNKPFLELSNNQQINFLDSEYKSKGESLFFLESLKNYSILHFETSKNYMIDYLNFEFAPGRYEGKVLI